MKFIKITVFYNRPYSQAVSFYKPLIVDLGTIYKLKGHEFHCQWAPLMSINEKHSAEKNNITYHQAYLKCDIRMSVDDQANEVK
jgi:hypothetical protein